MASTAPQQAPRTRAEELRALMDEDQATTVVDVRQPASYNSSPLTILGAVRIPPDEIAQRYREIPPDQPVVTFCTGPHETTSARVARFLLEHGYRHVSALQGGFNTWEALGYPTEEKSGA